ncbi:hypothetical protein A2W14_03465 [Candidatus Gottesmanbacteria bacterium RBG_16_37_8]|uniref:ABC transporter substrate-binding protein n=1 Tax=Candidatus Gottesmanbacteria bacterium RBG_16_37_8 TaxID=1798371 RepID=A0A1F5YUG9_9BACT|nr:MAG: hypothetical protein A2W14_03465 [Candidatus Gottesmanbacteria bacterium RBG_16_37_8]
MDNSSKQNQGEVPSSGQIFSEGESAYQEAANAPTEEARGQEIYSQESQPVYSEGSSQQQMDNSSAPPPFVEDPRRKFLFLALFVIIILALVFLLIRFLSSKRKASTDNIKKPKITLNYWGLWEEEEILRPIIEDYQKKNEGITINYSRQNPVNYRERLQAAIERGEGPDILRFHNTWLPMVQSSLAPLPKDIMSVEDFAKIFYPVAVKDLKAGDNFYGLPLEIDGLLLFYNEDILNGAGVPVPQTWVDVQNSVAKLTVKEGNRIVTSAIALGTAENIEHFSDILGLMMLQNGTLMDKSLFTCADSKTTDCAVEALTFYRKFATPPGNAWDNSLENSINAFAQGKVAMIFAPVWQAYTIQTINPDLNFKTAKVPQLPCNQNPCPEVNWASYWVEGVSVKSQHQKEAWQFLKYLISAEGEQALYKKQTEVKKIFGEPYSRVDLGKNLNDNPYLAPLIESAPTMQSFYLASRTFDGDTGLNSGLITYLKDAVNALSEHGASEETVLKTADSGFQQVLARFNLGSPAPAE